MQMDLHTRLQGNKRWIYTGAILVLVLVLVIVMSTTNARLYNANEKNEKILLAIAKKLQSELVFALRTYDAVYKSDVDFDGTILPVVQRHLNTAMALNEILLNGYGTRHAVFKQDFYNRMEHFYSEYELALKASRSTADAMHLLDSCMHDVETLVLTRFEADGTLILQSAQ